MFTVSVAVLPSCGHVTVTVTGTVPAWFGAVHNVERSDGCASVPLGADQRYVTAQPIELFAVAVTVELPPDGTVHGLHSARTVRLCVGAAGGGAAGGGGGGGAGATYVRTPGCHPIRTCQS